jgi:hypothetical protein
VHRIQYHSCYHRSCPQCAELDRERWLAVWKQRLLECGHVHCIFTTPHDLIPLWRYNKRLFGNLLFRAAMSALSELLDRCAHEVRRLTLSDWNELPALL